MLKRLFPIKLIVVATIFAMNWATGLCQTPFERTGQVFVSLQSGNEINEIRVNPSNFVPESIASYQLPNLQLDAIGFRKTDNLLYGINPINNHLIKVGADGQTQDMGQLPLDNSLLYLAGDISPDGKELISIGSSSLPNDVHLAKTNLENGSFSTVFVPIINASLMADIAFDPITGELYGYDRVNKVIVKINTSNGIVTTLHEIGPEYDISGIYFDAFGRLHGYGRAVFGIVDGFFDIDKQTGVETLRATGPVSSISDAASCPFSIEIMAKFEPNVTLPCDDILITYTIANGSGTTQTGIDFVHKLPSGFHLSAVPSNPFGVPVDTLSQPGSLIMENLSLPPGLKNLSFRIHVNDIPAAVYKSQPTLYDLPPNYGAASWGDNQDTPGFEDSLNIRVNRFDEDSLFYDWLICHGETLVLDASEFGNSFVWNTGSTSSLYEVAQGGVYFLNIGSDCEELVVVHEVTSTSCPFTISLSQVYGKDSIFACNDNVMKFIFRNDSGEKREGITLTDSLPIGFSFLEILQNPFGGNLVTGLPSAIVAIENMSMGVGTDTLEILVHIGNVPPGIHKNRAILGGLPTSMGPTRLSDDPKTLFFDSTALFILGTLEDTLFLDTIVCLNSELILDASLYGTEFKWENGSTAPKFTVKKPGTYQVTLFDGCEPAEIIWEVGPAEAVHVDLPDTLLIHQGEQIQLNPLIINEGESLSIEWSNQNEESLSCMDCQNPIANPLHTEIYRLLVYNESCSDTAEVRIWVDESRRIYAPTAFSPNGDGINDFFYLQSPDQGNILSLAIFDRWGNSVYLSKDSKLNNEGSGWNGLINTEDANLGIFTWKASIQFIDGELEDFFGSILLLR